MNRKVKIVCTLGPASLNRETLGAMMDAGLDVARLNFSHGTHESHFEALKLVRALSGEKNRPVGVMLDTKGPEIRTTLLEKDQPVMLQQGQTFELRPDDGSRGCDKWVGITHATLARECEVGQDVFIDDGTLRLRVKELRGDVIVCEVIVGGPLSNRKGVNVPDAEISLPTLSEKDKEDILWGVKNDVDFVAVSFVRNRDDVLAVRRVIEEAGGDMKIIAKIESRKAVERLEEIADVVDGMMVARGDLGVEIPTENVPLVQKEIIDICRSRGKPTIVATQMLDSMIRNPRPTRAEANDVANAVLDGADAVMLSGESAAGKYPVLAVETMAKIVLKAQEGLKRWQRPFSIPTAENNVPDGVSMAAVEISAKMKASAIVSLTHSGSTARMVSKYRPVCPIIAVTPSVKCLRWMSLYWGIFPIIAPTAQTEEEAIKSAVQVTQEQGYVKEGDLLVVTAGLPLGVTGTTNMLRVCTIGRMVVQGLPVLPGVVTGRVFVAENDENLDRIQKGDILVTRRTNAAYMEYLDRLSALVTEEGGLTSHAAIISLEASIPCIVGARGAVKALKTGQVVTVDSHSGILYGGVVNTGA